MSIGSSPSTPPQSPLIGRGTNLIQIPSPHTAEPPISLVSDHLPISQQAPEEKEYIAVTAIDVPSRSSQVSPVSSETVDMDLQSSPSSSEVDEDEIPGFITGSLSRRPVPPPRQPSPLVLSPPQAKPQPIAAPPPPSSMPLKHTIPAPNEPMSPDSTTLVPPPVRRPPLVKNPFVSGGFMTEFVGEHQSLTPRVTPSPKELMASEKYNATTTAVRLPGSSTSQVLFPMLLPGLRRATFHNQRPGDRLMRPECRWSPGSRQQRYSPSHKHVNYRIYRDPHRGRRKPLIHIPRSHRLGLAILYLQQSMMNIIQ
ncbi:hypothetical protein EDD16DRAFT_685142 [Pisolithus croceorrhizus]|nr:hypothetical protein EDD16DRAFT_685142 [Pisolithus croceorrhizus]